MLDIVLDARESTGMRPIKLPKYGWEHRKHGEQDGMRSEIQARAISY